MSELQNVWFQIKSRSIFLIWNHKFWSSDMFYNKFWNEFWDELWGFYIFYNKFWAGLALKLRNLHTLGCRRHPKLWRLRGVLVMPMPNAHTGAMMTRWRQPRRPMVCPADYWWPNTQAFQLKMFLSGNEPCVPHRCIFRLILGNPPPDTLFQLVHFPVLTMTIVTVGHSAHSKDIRYFNTNTFPGPRHIVPVSAFPNCYYDHCYRGAFCP